MAQDSVDKNLCAGITTPRTQEGDQDENSYIRVSTISSLFSDFSAIPPDVLEAAQLRGEEVHKLCTAIALNLPTVPAYQGYIDSFKRWFDSNVEAVWECEQRRFCKTHMITGRIDLLVRMKGDQQLTLVDLKTSTRHYASWNLQLGGYRYLLREVAPKHEVARCMTVRLRADGKNALVNELEDVKAAEHIFFSALACYRYLKIKPKNIEVE